MPSILALLASAAKELTIAWHPGESHVDLHRQLLASAAVDFQRHVLCDAAVRGKLGQREGEDEKERGEREQGARGGADPVGVESLRTRGSAMRMRRGEREREKCRRRHKAWQLEVEGAACARDHVESTVRPCQAAAGSARVLNVTSRTHNSCCISDCHIRFSLKRPCPKRQLKRPPPPIALRSPSPAHLGPPLPKPSSSPKLQAASGPACAVPSQALHPHPFTARATDGQTHLAERIQAAQGGEGAILAHRFGLSSFPLSLSRRRRV